MLVDAVAVSLVVDGSEYQAHSDQQHDAANDRHSGAAFHAPHHLELNRTNIHHQAGEAQCQIQPNTEEATQSHGGKDGHVWTVNDSATMSTLIRRGVDGLITDKPALARSVLDWRSQMSVAERLIMELTGLFGVIPEIGEQ